MFKQTSTNTHGFRIVILLIFLTGATFLLISPVSADPASMGGKPVVTIAVRGAPAISWGEKIVLAGMNTDSDSTYLFLTGPNVAENGGKLTSPRQKVVTGKPDTFTVVKTKPDKTWEYSLYTSGVPLDAGAYTFTAVSKPVSQDQFGDTTTYGTTSIIVKKPFITGGISPVPVTKGQAFTITGTAEGQPPAVQIWILGPNYVFTTKVPVNPDASFTFNADAAMSGKLPAGENYLFVQHPMQNNTFDIIVSGDYVRNQKLNSGTNLFRATGPGSLQGSDAADALIAAFTNQEDDNHTYTNDMYAVIPFQVNDAGTQTSQAPVTTASGSSAGTGVTIAADGSKAYFLGEKVVFRGKNADSDFTYLFLTGPNLKDTGAKLTSPGTAAVSGNPDTFTVVKTKPDKTWEYSFYTANLPFDAGSYTVYATSQPKAMDQLGQNANSDGIILKRPFITAKISSSEVAKGQLFTVTGIAVGQPPSVQVWIIGNGFAYTAKTPVNSDGAFTFNADSALSGKLAAGQYYLIVQHPMADNQFDIDLSGDYVRNQKLNNGENIFRITGPGSLQGSDAADALIAAFAGQMTHDSTLTHDTYTIIPFQVTDAGSQAPPSSAAVPVQQTTQQLPLQVAAPIGVGALALVGIILWKRH